MTVDLVPMTVFPVVPAWVMTSRPCQGCDRICSCDYPRWLGWLWQWLLTQFQWLGIMRLGWEGSGQVMHRMTFDFGQVGIGFDPKKGFWNKSCSYLPIFSIRWQIETGIGLLKSWLFDEAFGGKVALWSGRAGFWPSIQVIIVLYCIVLDIDWLIWTQECHLFDLQKRPMIKGTRPWIEIVLTSWWLWQVELHIIFTSQHFLLSYIALNHTRNTNILSLIDQFNICVLHYVYSMKNSVPLYFFMT